jgi:hypothetical protein
MANAFFANPAISLISSPPGSPANGDRYLIAPAGTGGAFMGRENQVAEWSAGAWTFSGMPSTGQLLVVGQLVLQYDAGWRLSSSNVFKTVAALLAATPIYSLADGASWRCAGRTSPNDGGGCVFCFDATDTSTPDNGGTVRVDSAGHRLKAEVVDPRQLPGIFGMKADHWTDDSAALQAMVNWAFSQNMRDVYLPPGAIGLGSSVFIPYGLMLHGQLSSYDLTRPSTRIITITGASYTNGFMMGFNTEDNSTEGDGGFYFGGGMENVCFLDEAGLGNAKGIIAFGHNYEFKNLGGRFMLQVLNRAENAYSDNMRIINPYYSNSSDPDVAQFAIAGGGDGLIIECGNFPPDQSRAIEIGPFTRGGAFGGVIRQCINGSMYIDGYNITIENWHAENSTLKIGVSAHVIVVNSNVGEDTLLTEPPIQMVDSIEFGNSSFLELNNVSFRWSGIGQFYSACDFDVSVYFEANVSIKNCRRIVNGVNSVSVSTGIRIAQEDKVTPVPGWEPYSDLLSKGAQILPGYNVILDHAIPSATGVYQGIWSTQINSSSVDSWRISTGTYYYNSVRMYDTTKMIGVTSAHGEKSATVTSTSSTVSLADYSSPRSAGVGPVQGMTRFYRGTAAGVYNVYADVPILAPDPAGITDDGDYVGGVRWKSRTSGGMDVIYQPDLTVPWHVYGVGVLKNMVPVITTPGNAAVTLRVASDQQVIYTSPITANRAVTLPALGRKGDQVRVTRTSGATGAFNVTIAHGGGSTTLVAPTRAATAEFMHNGTSWVLVAQSSV